MISECSPLATLLSKGTWIISEPIDTAHHSLISLELILSLRDFNLPKVAAVRKLDTLCVIYFDCLVIFSWDMYFFGDGGRGRE